MQWHFQNTLGQIFVNYVLLISSEIVTDAFGPDFMQFNIISAGKRPPSLSGKFIVASMKWNSENLSINC